jgi:hypothetical protein
MGWCARRPAYAALATERGQLLPSFASALGRFADHFGREPEQEVDECHLRGSGEVAETPPLLPAE